MENNYFKEEKVPVESHFGFSDSKKITTFCYTKCFEISTSSSQRRIASSRSIMSEINSQLLTNIYNRSLYQQCAMKVFYLVNLGKCLIWSYQLRVENKMLYDASMFMIIYTASNDECFPRNCIKQILRLLFINLQRHSNPNHILHPIFSRKWFHDRIFVEFH